MKYLLLYKDNAFALCPDAKISYIIGEYVPITEQAKKLPYGARRKFLLLSSGTRVVDAFYVPASHRRRACIEYIIQALRHGYALLEHASERDKPRIMANIRRFETARLYA